MYNKLKLNKEQNRRFFNYESKCLFGNNYEN